MICTKTVPASLSVILNPSSIVQQLIIRSRPCRDIKTDKSPSIQRRDLGHLLLFLGKDQAKRFDTAKDLVDRTHALVSPQQMMALRKERSKRVLHGSKHVSIKSRKQNK